MTDLKMPELNNIIISGNLTRDPMYRQTSNGTPVMNFTIASNRKYRDMNNHWQEEVCYVGVVAWNKLAESCLHKLKKGCAVLVDGELQSHLFKNDDGGNRNVVEIKARRIQFLNKKINSTETSGTNVHSSHQEEEPCTIEDDSYDKFLSNEELQLIKEQPSQGIQG